jgi:hypothetical protein
VKEGEPDAPDLIDAISAWRIWRVVGVRGRVRLASAFKWAIWPPGLPLEAECPWGRSLVDRALRRPEHHSPSPSCVCGIYGAELGLLDEGLSVSQGCRRFARVVGEVSLWGTVVECERGYRASRAYPRRLYVPLDVLVSAADDLVEALSVYRVPVELLPVAERCAVEQLRRVESIEL